MNLMLNLVVAVQILSALVMIGLVLIQHGKGADMGASFGSGASGSLFGATGSANFLSRFTAVCAAVFFLCTLALAHLSSQPGVPATGSGSVLDRAGVSAPAASAVAPIGAAQIPAAASGSGAMAPAAPGATTMAPAPAVPPAPSASGAGAVPTR